MKEKYKSHCPKCNSTALEISCSVVAKARYNVERPKAYKPNFYDIDGWFTDKINCLKCGWEGSEDELD